MPRSLDVPWPAPEACITLEIIEDSGRYPLPELVVRPPPGHTFAPYRRRERDDDLRVSAGAKLSRRRVFT
jgi:hypothetical protein